MQPSLRRRRLNSSDTGNDSLMPTCIWAWLAAICLRLCDSFNIGTSRGLWALWRVREGQTLKKTLSFGVAVPESWRIQHKTELQARQDAMLLRSSPPVNMPKMRHKWRAKAVILLVLLAAYGSIMWYMTHYKPPMEKVVIPVEVVKQKPKATAARLPVPPIELEPAPSVPEMAPPQLVIKGRR